MRRVLSFVLAALFLAACGAEHSMSLLKPPRQHAAWHELLFPDLLPPPPPRPPLMDDSRFFP